VEDKFSFENRSFSYWEKDVLSRKKDFIILGAGLVGLSTAISLKEKYADASVLVLERASIPYGASTRNAGFACFGSISEIIDDLNTLSTSEVELLINKRWSGLKILRGRLGDDKLMYKAMGGYEVFSKDEQDSYESCVVRLPEINKLIQKSTGEKDCFRLSGNHFGILGNQILIYNQYEGQLHPGMMMSYLKNLAIKKGIEILYGVEVASYNKHSQGVTVSSKNMSFEADKLLITTNAFTSSLISDIDLKPGRNQVMMTKPIKDLKVKGCFHFDKGYVYFRNFENRLLIGGGRNIEMEEETTDSFGTTAEIKGYLRKLLKEMILPSTAYEEDIWWSGIIATGSTKKPIIKEVEEDVFVGVRLGGMGVALGSLIGQELAELV